MPITVNEALTYAAANLPVLPLYSTHNGACLCPTGRGCTSPGKHPRPDLAPKGVHNATTDSKLIASWPSDINIGVALGQVAGGVMVFDVDDRQVAQDLLDASSCVPDQTGVVVTGKLGCHIWFRCLSDTHTFHVKRKDGGRLGEVRGDGAYVVVPPSIAATNRRYCWARTRSGKIPDLEATSNAIEYIKRMLLGVDIEIEDTAATAAIDVPSTPVDMRDIPAAIVKDSRLFILRQAFQGGVGKLQEPNRSGKLYGMACTLVQAADDAKYDIQAEEIAGILKKADGTLFDTPKYLNRPDADRYYWDLALKAIAQRQPAGQTASDYIWDANESVLYWQASPKTTKKVCNFRPEILEDIEVDYGDGASLGRAWRVRFTAKGGKVKEFVLDSKDRRSAAALEEAISRECSVHYVVEPQMYGRLKTALTAFGSAIPLKVYGASGWIEHGDSHLYLLPGSPGAIGPHGMTSSIKIDHERLPEGATISDGAFQAYGKGVRPPLSDEEKVSSWEAFARLVEAGKPHITFPIICQVLGGPLASLGAGESPALLHLMGRTGTLKTAYSMAALSLFGSFGPRSTPSITWGSTQAYRQILLHYAKDITLLVDDYKRSVTSRKETIQFVQNYADRSARGRAKPNQAVSTTPIPRGLLISTGEDRWEREASAEARTIVLHVKDGDIDKNRMSRVERDIEAGFPQLFGGAYIQWIAKQDRLFSLKVFKGLQTHWRKHLDAVTTSRKNPHLRLLATLSGVLTIASIVVKFAGEYYGKEQARRAQDWMELSMQALTTGLIEQAREVGEASPFETLITILTDGLTAQKACLYPMKGLTDLRPRIPARPGTDVVGYYFLHADKSTHGWSRTLTEDVVFLTRDTSFAWYEKEARSRGGEATFSWAAVMKEAEDKGGKRLESIIVRLEDGHSSQLSGVLVPMSELISSEEGEYGS